VRGAAIALASALQCVRGTQRAAPPHPSGDRMKKSLALMFAFSGLAAAAAPAHAGPSIIGDPAPSILAPPRGGGGGCRASLDEKKTLSWSKGQESAVGLDWNAGVSAGVGMFADCTKLEAYGSVGIDAQLFGLKDIEDPDGKGPLPAITFSKPLDVVISATTKSDNTNTVTFKTVVFGYVAKEETLASIGTSISGAKSMGYELPADLLDGSIDYPTDWAGDATVGFDGEAQLSAALFWKVSATEVSARALTGGYASARLYGSVGAYTKTVPFSIFRLTQGGSAIMKQVSGNQWSANAGNFVAFEDVLGAQMCWNIPFVGTKCLFDLVPGNYVDEYSASRTFTKAF
jgi:hypothetical protein